MKKILILFLILCLFGCAVHHESTPVEHVPVEMSVYEGMDNTDHHFIMISGAVFLDVLAKKGSGVFCLASHLEENSQKAMRLIEKAAAAENTEVRFIWMPEEEDVLKGLKTALEGMYTETEEGTVWNFPIVFSVMDGKIMKSVAGLYEGYEPGEDSDAKVVKIYRAIMEGYGE